MEIVLSLIGAITPILYALAAACYALLFARDEPFARRVATPLLVSALALHACELVVRGVVRGRIPLATVFETLSALAFALAFVYLYIEWRQKNRMTGIFVILIVFLLETVSSAFIDRTGPTPEILRSALFGLHVIAAVLGYCGFAIAAIYGILFLALYHELKSRRFSIVYDRLPPLEVLAQMNIRALSVGFFCLSFAISLGAIWVMQLDDVRILDPKVLLTILAWAIFGLSLFAHFFLRWGGPRVIYMSVTGFLFLVSSSIAVNVVGKSFHVFR
ncbi:MAG: inner membrane protein YpjD [bacterium]